MTHANPVPASGKIQGHHRDRQAVVYVRQSTLQQVARHQESTRLQYGLVDRAVSLGWPRTQVVVIDDDLGKSGSSAEGRPGFQRLVAAVSLEQVGIVLGIEMSRLARSCRDWHQLLEVCALFGTLIGDLDGVYDPRNYHDRLLLGLKGTMSEAELHVLKQRMLAGKLAKAGRGDLGMRLPMGYVRRPSGEVAKDPDEQARAAIQTVFDQFERLGTLNGVLQYLVRTQIQLPCRIAAGAGKGELEWHRPNRATLSNLLHHPIYAGAYAYGRRPSDPRRQQPGRPGTGRADASAHYAGRRAVNRAAALRTPLSLENSAKAPGHLLPDIQATLETFACRWLGTNLDFANYVGTGQDPIAAIRELGRWINYIHAKDAKQTGGGWRSTFLGNGSLPLREIVAALDATGKTVPLCFEFPGEGDPEGAIRKSLEFMRMLGQ